MERPSGAKRRESQDGRRSAGKNGRLKPKRKIRAANGSAGGTGGVELGGRWPLNFTEQRRARGFLKAVGPKTDLSHLSRGLAAAAQPEGLDWPGRKISAARGPHARTTRQSAPPLAGGTHFFAPRRARKGLRGRETPRFRKALE